MSMSRLKRLVVNQVNLGRLYSLLQRDAYLLGGASSVSPSRYLGYPTHGANLGKLYRGHEYRDQRYPQGWAYFDDGSMFIARSR